LWRRRDWRSRRSRRLERRRSSAYDAQNSKVAGKQSFRSESISLSIGSFSEPASHDEGCPHQEDPEENRIPRLARKDEIRIVCSHSPQRHYEIHVEKFAMFIPNCHAKPDDRKNPHHQVRPPVEGSSFEMSERELKIQCQIEAAPSRRLDDAVRAGASAKDGEH